MKRIIILLSIFFINICFAQANNLVTTPNKMQTTNMWTCTTNATTANNTFTNANTTTSTNNLKKSAPSAFSEAFKTCGDCTKITCELNK